jgi:hypothetical protein
MYDGIKRQRKVRKRNHCDSYYSKVRAFSAFALHPTAYKHILR